MEEFVRNSEDQKDILEAVEKIKKLQAQRQTPNRNGMIDALKDAKNKAPLEITALDADLYRKLLQYQQGLEHYCIEKIGEKAFDELMKK